MLFGGIVGYDYYDDGDAFLVNMSLAGNELWSKSYGGSKEDMIRSLLQTASGKILFAGSTNSNDGDVTGYHGPGDNRDVWIGITDTNGVLLKEHAFGGSMGDYGYSICETPDHGIIFSGISSSSDGDVTFNHGLYGFNDVWVVKLDSGLNIQWQKVMADQKMTMEIKLSNSPMEIIWLQVIPIQSMEILPIGMGQGISGSLKLILKEIYCGKILRRIGI